MRNNYLRRKRLAVRRTDTDRYMTDRHDLPTTSHCSRKQLKAGNFQPMWMNPPTSQTDRQTDDIRSQDCALH